ncbi:MAG: hypothetical protein J6B32_07055 [Spirochaetaceae bacterium]|nr:hypothetical protein [Spirochaetaceae bacterium]
MLQKIIKGYGNLLLSILKVLVLILLCCVCGFILVYPLWKLAVTNPNLYSIISFIFFAVLLAYFTARKIYTYINKSNPDKSEKHKRVIKLVNGLLKVLLFISGLVGIIYFIMIGKLIFSLAILVFLVLLYGFFSFGTKKNENKD